MHASLVSLTALAALAATAPLRGQQGGQQPPPPPLTSAPYPKLDHIQGTLVTTAAAPVRPCYIDSSLELWAINTGQSTVERFVPGSTVPFQVRAVPWGPVSIAEWDDPDPEVGPEILVVCRNTFGLLRMDKQTGDYKEFIPLPAEPSDIVVDPVDHRAMVSCTAVDAVVRIDLLERDGKFHARYDEETTNGALKLKSPYFLSIDDGLVRVAPLHSGNNTTATGLGFASTEEIVTLANPMIRLPDQDLFEIDPSLSPSDPGAVQAVAAGVGAILFAHGRNPADGRYWMLNTSARNADPTAQSEPALGFDFVENRLTILDGSSAAVTTAFEHEEDDFTPQNVIGQPFALAFHPNGNAFVAGLLTDNVTLFDEDGNRLALTGQSVVAGCIRLPEGSIPRGVAIAPTSPSVIAVYCWGTARIEVFLVNHNTLTVTALPGVSLSNDPLPEDLREGRQIFFDGARSARGNVSCASCHIDAGTDFLVWNLSGLPHDDKGPMVTQTLVGLERVSPFHWRGERSLDDFNTFAFPGLLGNLEDDEPAPIPEEDFDKMKSWLLALRNPANPFQDRHRLIESANPDAGFIAPTQTREFTSVLPAGLPGSHPLLAVGSVPASLQSHDAVAGLGRFTGEIAFQGFRCVECHQFPVGTDNDITDDEGQGDRVKPERQHFKNIGFHEIWRKRQSLVLVEYLVDGQPFLDVRTFLGTGVAHAGKVADLARFVQPVVPDNPAFVREVAALIQQWDQGIAPAAHYGYWLSAASTPQEITKELVQFLLAQASETANADGSPNCDIAIFQSPATGPNRAWYLDRPPTSATIGRNDDVFVVDSDSQPDTRSLQDFIDEAATTPSLIIGLPVGMAERFAVDFDMDLVKNRSDAQPFAVNPPSDNDPPSVSARIGWVTTNSARVYVETDEPTTLEIDFREMPAGPLRTVTSPMLSRVHAVLLTDLRPSTDVTQTVPYVNESVTYDIVQIRATDAAFPSNTTDHDPDLQFATQAFDVPSVEGPGPGIVQTVREHVMTNPPAVSVGSPNALGRRVVTVELSAFYKQGGSVTPAENRVFVVRAFRIRDSGDPLPLVLGTGLFNTAGGSGTTFAEEVELDSEVGTSPVRALDIAGTKILNSTPTDATGAATLRFRVASPVVQANDLLVITVEAVVEVMELPGPPPQAPVVLTDCGSGSCATVTLSTARLSAFSQWDFPRTTEANFQGKDIVD